MSCLVSLEGNSKWQSYQIPKICSFENLFWPLPLLHVNVATPWHLIHSYKHLNTYLENKHTFTSKKHFGITKSFHWHYLGRLIPSSFATRLAVLTEQKPRSVVSSCVFPGDNGYFTSSKAIISRVRKGRTELAEVKWNYMGMVTGERESRANCLYYSKNLSTPN